MLPTPGSLFAAIVFGAVGLAAFLHGRRTGAIMPVLAGVTLMAYPYFVTDTTLSIAIGLGLCGLLYVFRD
jgi:hypothetical protein